MRKNPYHDLFQLIDESSCCSELKSLLREFTLLQFTGREPLIDNNSKRFPIRSLKYLIGLMSGLDINQISWSNFCLTLEKIHFDQDANKPGSMLQLVLREFYKYLITHTSVQTESINTLRIYIKYLDIPERRRIQHEVLIHTRIYNEVYLNFGVNTIPSKLYHYSLPSQGKKDDYYSLLINLETDNSFIRKILIEFIESYPKDNGETKFARTPTTLLFNQFIYYFYKSLYGVNDEPSSIENTLPIREHIAKNYEDISDFDFKTFRKQFRFYSMIDEKYPVTAFRKKYYGEYRSSLLDLLKAFYIFLLNLIEEKNIDHNPFFGTDINKDILMGPNFNTFFKQGYCFINDVRMNEVPNRNRVAVITTEYNEKARGNHVNYRAFDFSIVRDKNFKCDLSDYIFHSRYTLSTRHDNYYYLLDFLDFKMDYDKARDNVSVMNNDALFSEDFMFSYRLHVMERYEVNSTMDKAVGAVKKFLNYHKKKYKPGDSIFKYLRCFEKDKSGGKPIPLKDYNDIMEVFRNIKDESINNELCFIVFYLCSTCKIRFGEILKLQRNCIVSVSEGERTGIIKLFAKGSDRNMITEIIPIACINMLERAMSITEEYSRNGDKNKSNYIFIIEARKYRGTGSTINTAYLASYYNDVFLKVQKIAGIKNRYTPYQVRHTRKNVIYEEGYKAGYSDFEINEMLGGTVQVNLKNYIKRHNNELYVEIFAGVTISNVDINGNVILTDLGDEQTLTVGDGIGSCDKSICNEKSFSDAIQKDVYKCLICSNFRTSCSKIGKFRDEIMQTKSELENCSDENDKRFFESKLKLLGAYLKKLLDIESGEVNCH